MRTYLIVVIILLAFQCCKSGENASSLTPVNGLDTLFIYVNKEGKNEWTGRLNKPNKMQTDGPLASPQRAIERISEVRQDSVNVPVVVQIAPGTYYLDSTLVIPEIASGTKDAVTVIRGAEDQQTALVGGIVVTTTKAPTTFLDRIDSSYLDKISEIDIKALGIDDLGSLEPRGFPRPKYLAPVEVFVNRNPLQIARWPNEGWAKIADVKKGRFGDQFNYSGDRPDRWLKEKEIWLHGFWARDWADSYVRVEKIDTTTNTVKTQKPYGTYGYIKGKRYYALNILEELDSPGEWYFNKESGKIHLWLPETDQVNTELILSLLPEPILQLQNTSFVRIENMTLEVTRATGVQIISGNHNTITKVQIRNTGNLGLEVTEGFNNAISDCEIYNTGEGGIRITGGNRDSLINAEHVIYNNEIHHTNRWVKTYSPGIQLEGVGVVVKNNYIHDIPHMAIRIIGNEHLIERNEIARIGSETGDSGAIYLGKDWTMRGNTIRHNYFHDINSKYHRGLMGVYLDDLASGTIIDGNIFKNVQRAVVVGGGRDNIVRNNVFQSSRSAAVRVEYRQATAVNAEDQLRKRLESVPYLSEAWKRKYPELLTILKDDPLAPKNNIIENNTVVDGKWLEITNKAKVLQKMKNNNIINGTNLRSEKDSNNSASLDKFEGRTAIPMSEIGIQK